MIASFFSWNVLENNETLLWADIMSLTLTVVGIMCVLAIPILVVKLWNKRWQALENEEFKNKYGALYEG